VENAIATRFRPELRGFLLALSLAALGAAGATVAGGALAGAERNASTPRHQPAHRSGGTGQQSPGMYPAPANASSGNTPGANRPAPSTPRGASPAGVSPGPSPNSRTGTGTGPTQISGPTAPEPAAPPTAPSDGGSHVAEQNPVGGGQGAPRSPLD
jgi:hypothetical protein